MKLDKLGSFLFMSAFVFLFAACKSNKVVDNSLLTENDIILTLKRGACFGKCPIYKVNLYNNGYVQYDAQRFVDTPGLYEKNLSKKEFKTITEMIDNSNYMAFDDDYPSEIVDLPLITLIFNQDGNKKMVRGREERPAKVKEIQYALESLITEEGWMMVEKYEEKEPEENTKEDNFIYSEILIKPTGKNRLPLWFKKNKEYGFSLMKRISKENNLWLITYDTKKYKPQQIMDILKNDAEIEMAEFNKKVSNRENEGVRGN